MAERIEYQGNPLPSGLPGFGGGSVETVLLPGFNSVALELKFGPAVEALEVIPPSPTPPAGSNPNEPTLQEVSPAPAPPSRLGVGVGPSLSTPVPNPNLFTIQPIQVCVNGEPKTWYIQAYQPDP
jgi:hypothetical protein